MGFGSFDRSAHTRATLVAVASAVVWGAHLFVLAPAAVVAQEDSPRSLLGAIEDVFTDVVARCEPSVVSISRIRRREGDAAAERPFNAFDQRFPQPTDPDYVPAEYGTGVVVDSSGLVLTAYHVVPESEDEYFVTTSDRSRYQARIIAADPRSDLAMLKIQASDLVPIKFGDAKSLRKGQIVFALGNPYAIALDGQASVSWGVISNLSRRLGPELDETQQALNKPTLYHGGAVIQTDAKLNLGTSGGALVNLDGEMIGLITSRAALAGYEQSAGYAVPVDDVFRRIVGLLREGREVDYGFLGVGVRNLPIESTIRGQHGAVISNVVPGTPAYQSQLKELDLVSAVNGESVFDADAFIYSVGSLASESVARLTVQRGGKMIEIPVELAKYPVVGKKIITNRRPGWRGVRVEYLTAVPEMDRLMIRHEHTYGAGGVVVIEAEPEAPGAVAGLREGTLITHVGNVRVRSPREFYDAVAGAGGPVELRIGFEQTEVVVEPETGT